MSLFLIHSVPGIHSAMYSLAATLNSTASICSVHTWLSVFMEMSACFLLISSLCPLLSDLYSSSLSFSSCPFPSPLSSSLIYIWPYPVLSCPLLSVIPISFLQLAQICISSPPRDSYHQLHHSYTIFICHPCLYPCNYNQTPSTK